jgi:hypothetical protein
MQRIRKEAVRVKRSSHEGEHDGDGSWKKEAQSEQVTPTGLDEDEAVGLWAKTIVLTLSLLFGAW